MPNQNKCDHIVGVFAIRASGLDFIMMATLSEQNKNYKELDLDFLFCPNCGAKIDWDKGE